MSCQISIPCREEFLSYVTLCYENVDIARDEVNTIFIIPDICIDDFNGCNYVVSTTFDIFIDYATIDTFVYYNSNTDTYAYEPTEGYELIGFTLLDQSSTPITIEAGSGTLCFINKDSSKIFNESIYNFKLKILSLQCEFSKKVYKCIQEIKFGKDNRNVLKNLKLYKKTLEILNRYDVRDIVGETTDYNVFTYNEIKTLLNKL
jgi:hypothetical protein